MINYKIHYAATGFSPQERLAKAETNFLAYIVDEVAKPKRYITFEKIVNKVAAALNNLLKVQNEAMEDSSTYRENGHENSNSLVKLLEVIIPELKELEKHNPARGNAGQQITNKKTLAELEELKKSPGLNPATVMDILVKFKIEGIERIEFTTGINQEILSDIEYPTNLVSGGYNCSVLTTVMSDPIVATPTERIERIVTAGARVNPFTRQPWFNVLQDDKLCEEINGFVKKVEWLHYACQDNEQYKKLYHDLQIQKLLKQHELSYEDFKHSVNQYLQKSLNRSVTSQAVPYPCKYILDLFAQCDIHVVQPTKKDYEQLIRHLTLLGKTEGLKRLLDSPILEFIKVNVYSRNDKAQNVLDLLVSYRQGRPELKDKHDQCCELLSRYQDPTANETPSACKLLSERVYNYLPSFNRYTALTALASIGTAIYLGYNNSDAPRAMPNI